MTKLVLEDYNEVRQKPGIDHYYNIKYLEQEMKELLEDSIRPAPNKDNIKVRGKKLVLYESKHPWYGDENKPYEEEAIEIEPPYMEDHETDKETQHSVVKPVRIKKQKRGKSNKEVIIVTFVLIVLLILLCIV